MRLPSLSILKDKWVLIGLAAGAGVYYFMGQGHHMMAPKRHIPMIHHPTRHPGTSSSHDYFPHYDTAGLYETGQTADFSHMHFSGQAELQRRLTIS